MKKIGESDFKHKLHLKNKSIERSLKKKERERNNKIEKYCDYTSHNLKEFIQSSDYINVNKVLKKHIYKNNTLEHEKKKIEKFVELIYLGHDVILEPQLVDKSLGRPDVLLLDQIPAIAYEIVCSEKESSLSNKDVKYPFLIKRIEVKQ